MKKPRICKCGHDRSDHIKEPRKKFSLPNECNRCKCSEYYIRDKPNKGDLIYLVFGIVMVFFMLFPSLDFLVFERNDKLLEMKSSITNGDLLTIIFGMFLIVIFLLILPVFVYPYIFDRNRRIYPVES